MKIAWLIIYCMALMGKTVAQKTHFIRSGVVEFEKSVNMYALVKKQLPLAVQQSYMDRYKKDNPRFVKLKSILKFGSGKSIFQPSGNENDLSVFGYELEAGQPNVVYTDWAGNRHVVQKQISGQRFLLQDTIRRIEWKITDETREIAGYTCRRANAIIMDSLYVVAFYADNIVLNAGPESFSGLPGMILGLALPHEHITWFATSVREMPVAANEIQPPDKGKAVSDKDLMVLIKEVVGAKIIDTALMNLLRW